MASPLDAALLLLIPALVPAFLIAVPSLVLTTASGKPVGLGLIVPERGQERISPDAATSPLKKDRPLSMISDCMICRGDDCYYDDSTIKEKCRRNLSRNRSTWRSW